MNGTLDKLETMANKLRDNVLVKNVLVKKGEGLPLQQINTVENLLGIRLDTSFKEFYTLSNGFDLTVEYDVDKINENRNAINELTDFSFLFPEDEENPYISIRFLEFDQIFSKPYFIFDQNSVVNFNNREYTLKELSYNIRPFDVYSGFSCMAIFLSPEENKMKLLMLDGHYDDWVNSRFIDFDLYIELIVRTGGICEARRKYLSSSHGHALGNIGEDELPGKNSIPLFYTIFDKNQSL
jgi:hypothetical protein